MKNRVIENKPAQNNVSHKTRTKNKKRASRKMPYYIENNGDPRRTRTFDPMVKSLVKHLYLLHLTSILFVLFSVFDN